MTPPAASKEDTVSDYDKLLADTFVVVADTMVTNFDLVDFLSLLANRCVELFDAGDAGIMLVDEAGHMEVVASSSNQMHLLELFELQHDDGPCPDAFKSGKKVESADLHETAERWPMFGPEALQAGFSAAFAFPMRLRDQTIGALNLLREQTGLLTDEQATAAQALADVATIGILHHRASEEYRLLSEQLQYALTSRVTVEQAKGVVSQQLGIDVDAAFEQLRAHSRRNNQRLADVAASIVDRSLQASALIAGPAHAATIPPTS